MRFSKTMFTLSLKGVKMTALIGICTLLGTQFFISNQVCAATFTPNNYTVPELTTASLNRQAPTGYIKGIYKVVWNTEIAAKEVSPSAQDLSMQDAANIMAQEIFKLTNQNISNVTFKMLYAPLTKSTCSTWFGEVQVTPTLRFNIGIKANSGEFLSIVRTIHDSNNLYTANSNHDTGNLLNELEAAGKQNKAAYCEKAKKLIEQSGFLNESIQSVDYVDSNLHDDIDYASKNQPKTYHIATYEFKMTTSSNKTYSVQLDKDLSQIYSITDNYLFTIS